MKSKVQADYLFWIGIMVSTLIFSPAMLDLTLIPRFVSLSLFLFASLFLIKKNVKDIKIEFDLILISYVAYCLFNGLSAFWAINKAEALFQSSKTLLAFSVFCFTYLILKQGTFTLIEKLIKFSVMLVFAECLVVLIQFINIPELKTDSLYALSGLNGHKNLLASFLFLNLFFLIKGIRDFRSTWKVLTILALLLNLFLLIFLKTKAVWIGLVVFSILLILLFGVSRLRKKLQLKPQFLFIVCLIVANVFFLLVLKPLSHRSLPLINSNTSSGQSQALNLEQERLVLWQKTYAVFEQQPLIGVGAGNWQINFQNAGLSGLWRAEDLNFTFQRPHNDFLWILSETGILGFNLFLIFILTLVLSLGRFSLQNDQSKSDFLEPKLLLAFIVAYYCISFFDFPMERMEHLIWINILLGLAYYYSKEQKIVKVYSEINFSRALHLTYMLCLLFVCVIGILRYKGEYYIKKVYTNKNNQNYFEVIKCGEKAQSFAYTLDPTSLPIAWYTGNAYASSQNFQKGHHEFLKAYRLNPFNRNVLNDLASSYAYIGKVDSAKALYIEASRISPRFDDPKLNLTALYIQEKNFKKAKEILKTIYHDSERRSKYQSFVDMQP